MRDYIEKCVHDEYYLRDTNCARTSLICYSHIFNIDVPKSVYIAAAAMHGAGGHRAQCGLVEGALLFIPLYVRHLGLDEAMAVKCAYDFASFFEEKFSSLTCFDLRPNGFNASDPPHLCEALTVNAIESGCEFLSSYRFCAKLVDFS